MSKILDKLADQHEERIINVLYRLEEDVVREVTRATGGKLVSQRLAIQLRPQIRNLIETTFLDEADIIINDEYNKIAKEVLDTFGEMPIPKKFKSLTEVDLRTLNALKTQSFSGFEDVAERFLKVINDEVYQSTIAGRPFEDMVSNIRSHINGVYKRSNTAEINELVDFINENKFDSAKKAQVEDAVRKLHTQYASDRAGNNLRRYASQIAHDSVMQFHGQFTIAKAKEAGLTHFTYTGTLVRDSREFCVSMLNKTLTEEQIREMWINRSWQGKSTGDPFIVRGGYRCRHTWIPTDPSWGEETLDQVPEEPEIEETPIPPVVDETDIFAPTIDNSITETTVNVISASDGVKVLNRQFKQANLDNRYLNKKRIHFGGREVKDFGKANLKGLSDKAVSMLVAIKPELDALADKFKIPRIRGFKTSDNLFEFNANMGDGIMGLQVKFHNSKASNLANLEQISEKNKKEFQDRITFLEKDIKKRQDGIKEFLDGRTYNDLNEFDKTLFDSKSKAILTLNSALDELTQKLSSGTLSKNYLQASKWKRGDDLIKRPRSTKDFETNYLDQFRTVFYHEMGHHVHQMYKQKLKKNIKIEGLQEPSYKQVEKPLEKRLNKVQNINEHSPSGYGATNNIEWFAENFSLYYRGKENLVAPEFIKILQEIKDDKIN